MISGLLVLIALLLPVGGVGAHTLSAFSDTLPAALSDLGERHSALTIQAVRHSSEPPSDGCEHPDNRLCCLFGGFVVGKSPSSQTASRPVGAAPLTFSILSSLPPDGLSSAPDLSPPRHIV